MTPRERELRAAIRTAFRAGYSVGIVESHAEGKDVELPVESVEAWMSREPHHWEAFRSRRVPWLAAALEEDGT